MSKIYEYFKSNINLAVPIASKRERIEIILKELSYKLKKENLNAYKLNDKYLPIKQSNDNLNEYYIDFTLVFSNHIDRNRDSDWTDEDMSTLSNIIIDDWGFPKVTINCSSKTHNIYRELLLITIIITLYFELNLTSESEMNERIPFPSNYLSRFPFCTIKKAV